MAWSTYGTILLAFKSGEGQLDPDWAVFKLAAGTLTGNWSISGDQSLSHANLYGGDAASPVPEPTSMLLLGTGHCFRDHVLEVCPEYARFSSDAEGMRKTFEGSSLETIKHTTALPLSYAKLD